MQLIQQGTAELQKAINSVLEQSKWKEELVGHGIRGTKDEHGHRGSCGLQQEDRMMGNAWDQHDIVLLRPQKYKQHVYNGKFHLLPKWWRFTSVGPLDMWLQWWLGDSLRGVPPLSVLLGKDVKHLDSVVGHTGRKSTKILSDLRFLMEYIEDKVRLVGMWNRRSHTVESIISMYNAVVDEDYLVIRDDGPH